MKGIDYWTVPSKVHLQVDFLESHSDYSLLVHGYSERDKGKGAYKPYQIKHLEDTKDDLALINDTFCTIDDLQRELYFPNKML